MIFLQNKKKIEEPSKKGTGGQEAWFYFTRPKPHMQAAATDD